MWLLRRTDYTHIMIWTHIQIWLNRKSTNHHIKIIGEGRNLGYMVRCGKGQWWISHFQLPKQDWINCIKNKQQNPSLSKAVSGAWGSSGGLKSHFLPACKILHEDSTLSLGHWMYHSFPLVFLEGHLTLGPVPWCCPRKAAAHWLSYLYPILGAFVSPM